MPEHVDFLPLQDLLEQQFNGYSKLLTLMEEMRDCLIKVNPEALNKLVRAQSLQLRQLDALEKKRHSAGLAICAGLGLNPNSTLNELLTHAPEENRAPLNKLYEDFARLIQQIQAAQDLNKELLYTNMDLNETMLSLLTGPEDPLNNFYSADGREAEERIISPGIFDQQI